VEEVYGLKVTYLAHISPRSAGFPRIPVSHLHFLFLFP
jgi:hypothetical protein